MSAKETANKYKSVLATFRLIAPKLREIDNKTVLQWINLTAPLVSKRKFGNLWEQALALMTAHRMTLSGVGLFDNETETENETLPQDAYQTARVSSYSEGSVSISYNDNLEKLGNLTSDLGMTEYGVQYQSLLRLKVIPILNSGER
ncbi:MAG: DUF4054 domain-containing protein [Firmicutes bacterium]|nr:DUF4054 domain-containing protein [Bacillota bacterium]